MYVVFDQEHEPVFGESAEGASHDAFRGADGSGNATGLSPWVGRDVREHHQVLAMSALHQVFAEEAGSADAEAQGRGEGCVVGFRLGGPCIHGAERQEDRSGNAGRSKCGFRQVGLLARTMARDERQRLAPTTPLRSPWSVSDLVFSGEVVR